MKETNFNEVEVPVIKLFAGEKWLVVLSLIGFALALGIGIYIGIYDSIVLPEGDLERAFSFDAAFAIFILSIAAILPLAGLNSRKRTVIRWSFIVTSLFAYGAETVQQFRGVNPRFSQVGSVGDLVVGMLFGLDSLLIIIVTVLFAIPFFRQKQANSRPLLVLGIRYAFLSIMIAFIAGLWMIALSGRFTGAAGNLIVLHGVGFHSLQTLPILGWLLERALVDKNKSRRLIHVGSIAWMVVILLIGVQTALGCTVFEWTALPLLTALALVGWLATVGIAAFPLLRKKALSDHQAMHRS
ncbi:hypothetical protein GK047_06880 [Paenibacillus sp. SYP-B3998]|uniref:Uncharacterized protein n=1 Tax=Paenibacillus sp. SYP-B3998 TaxID=2678564 RepID=A0A6G3ZUC6_9BACL|nr:hypothetical protein [Paenibacillus sp. SYP-B3998]NEW05742.1 hypothetical protein [Paenibacillus sp. SYP-B3998]